MEETIAALRAQLAAAQARIEAGAQARIEAMEGRLNEWLNSATVNCECNTCWLARRALAAGREAGGKLATDARGGGEAGQIGATGTAPRLVVKGELERQRRANARLQRPGAAGGTDGH
jgi:hypothetical protein